MTTTITSAPPTGRAATAARLRRIVEALCADECLPRLPGTPGGLRARAITKDAFAERGLEPAGVDDYFHSIPSIGGASIVGRLPGPSRDRTILVASHYDACAIDGGINPGADDNASGVAVMLEVARELRRLGTELGRNVVFVSFDAEEPPYFQGPTMGSMAFVADPPFPLDTIDAVINLDNVGHSVGEASPPEIAETMTILGAESSPSLGRVLATVPAVVGLTLRRLDSQVFPRMSDHAAFEDVGIPFVFYSCGRDRHYHAPTDTPDKLNYDKMAALVDHLVAVVIATCRAPEERFGFTAGGSDPAGTINTLRALAPLLSADSRIGRLAPKVLDGLAAKAGENELSESDWALLRRIHLAFDDTLTEMGRPTEVTDGCGLEATARLVDQIGDALSRPGLVVVLSGAGISVESGIPTYRGDNGRWTAGGAAAMDLATRAHFMEHPDETWAWYLARRAEVATAQPNAGHVAIVELEALMGERFRLITQNVDRLHVVAGNALHHTVEVHGHLDAMRCSGDCMGTIPIPGAFADWSVHQALGAAERKRLTCLECGCATRPHVLWFDEFYDEDHYQARTAHSWAARTALCITVGTSGGIQLAPRLASIAAAAGATLIDVNPNDNALRQLAIKTGGISIQEAASDGLCAVVDAIKEVL